MSTTRVCGSATSTHDPAVRAVVVSPTHQFPTGVVLSAERRAALLDWARRVDGLILEDDYDAEFRYDRRPVGTMQGTDRSRVALLGSVSKTLSPALGIGWVVAPPDWVEPLRAAAGPLGWPSTLDQLAFAAFLQAGSYDRHLRAARKRYRLRRDRLVRALAERLPGARLLGVAAGLHLLVLLDDAVDCAAGGQPGRGRRRAGRQPRHLPVPRRRDRPRPGARLRQPRRRPAGGGGVAAGDDRGQRQRCIPARC